MEMITFVTESGQITKVPANALVTWAANWDWHTTEAGKVPPNVTGCWLDDVTYIGKRLISQEEYEAHEGHDDRSVTSTVKFCNQETGEVTELAHDAPIEFETCDTGYYVNASVAPYGWDCWVHTEDRGLVFVGQRVKEEETKVQLGGVVKDFKELVSLMDDELREKVHNEGVTEPQKFLDRYCELHYMHYGRSFKG